MLMVTVPIGGPVIKVLVLVVTSLMLVARCRVILRHVHLHLEAVVRLTAVQQRVLALMMALVEHVERRRMSAGRAVRRRSVVIVKAYPRVVDRRTVPLVEVPRIVRLLILRLKQILAGSWEPEATIGHLSMERIDIGEARRSRMVVCL